MNPVSIQARDLPDAWFQFVYQILSEGREYRIDHGSYPGQKRLEFDYITAHIKHPGVRPLIPDIPPSRGIPDPVQEGYIEEYMPYLMTSEKQPNEDYTYGERLAGWVHHVPVREGEFDGDLKKRADEAGLVLCKKHNVNQMERVCERYQKQGYGSNQEAMVVAIPSDINLGDSPCLRHIDTRIDGPKGKERFHFVIYFRSWDLWNGFPANLGGLQLMKEYMASEIGVEDGEIIASSKGLHLYDYVWEIAEQRTDQIGILEKRGIIREAKEEDMFPEATLEEKVE
ncbi:MAG: thymidylate synthase [archaeon]